MDTDVVKRKRLKWWHIALIAVGGFVVLIWAIGAIATAAGYEPEASDATAAPVTETPKVTPTGTPTATGKPTPKATPKPTSEPKPSAPAKPAEPKKVDRGAQLYGDIQAMLESMGEDAYSLKMFAVTSVDDEGSYLRVNYQNTVSNETDAEDVVREIYGFTASDAFLDGERNTIVVRGADGRDWNVWVTRDGSIARFSTSAWD